MLRKSLFKGLPFFDMDYLTLMSWWHGKYILLLLRYIRIVFSVVEVLSPTQMVVRLVFCSHLVSNSSSICLRTQCTTKPFVVYLCVLPLLTTNGELPYFRETAGNLKFSASTSHILWSDKVFWRLIINFDVFTKVFLRFQCCKNLIYTLRLVLTTFN